MRFRVHCANPETGEEHDLEIECASIQEAERKAQDAGMLVTKVVPLGDVGHQSQAPVPQPPTSPPTGGGVTCQVCGRGRMYRRKTYRLSGPVVVIGYILLIPSVLGIILNLVLVVLGVVGFAGTVALIPEAERQVLVDAGIPELIIEKLMSGEQLSDDESASLTSDQQQAVQAVQVVAASSVGGACCGAGILGGGAIVGAVICFVSGLLGWLLIMKKKVLQCAACQAIVPIS